MIYEALYIKVLKCSWKMSVSFFFLCTQEGSIVADVARPKFLERAEEGAVAPAECPVSQQLTLLINKALFPPFHVTNK